MLDNGGSKIEQRMSETKMNKHAWVDDSIQNTKILGGGQKQVQVAHPFPLPTTGPLPPLTRQLLTTNHVQPTTFGAQ